jgi:cell division protein FtsQ
MPEEIEDPDGDDFPRPKEKRFNGPRGPWWRPASTVGRVFVTVGALIVLGGLSTAGYFLKTYLEHDARFRIAGASNIQATGLTEVSRAEMLPVFGEDIGRNVFFVPLSERRRELEAIPWVQRATVMRLLPDQIRISVVERQPVAFTQQGAVTGLVDADGVLLSMSASMMAQRHYSFPVVVGIDPGDSAASRKARMAVYLRLLAELDANNQHNSAQISEIDLTDPEDARVTMQDDTTLLHFGEDRFLERYQRYKAHIAEWKQQYPKLAAADLRYDQMMVLKMDSGADTTQPAANGAAAPGAGETEQAAAKPAEDAPAKVKPASGKTVSGKAASSKTVSDKTASGKTVSGKTAAKGAQGKTGAHVAGKTKSAARAKADAKAKTLVRTKIAAKAKTSTTKIVAAKKNTAQNKKREELKRAALNASRRKPAPMMHPAAAAAEGQ